MHMVKIERVLVPVDGSDSSKNAAKYAAHLLNARNPTLYLLHVVKAVNMAIGGESAEELRKANEAKAMALLEEYRKMVEACGFKNTELLARSGRRPDYVILNTQEELDCDMIIIGSRGQSALENVVMGSVVTGVLEEATCPVLVTRNLRGRYLEEATGL